MAGLVPLPSRQVTSRDFLYFYWEILTIENKNTFQDTSQQAAFFFEVVFDGRWKSLFLPRVRHP